MRIFKNRGDIYISKSGYKKSKESRILVFLLVIIIVFTAVFSIYLSRRYSSVSEFFAQGEVTTTQFDDAQPSLPEISGKTNFLVLETDDDETVIHYIFLIQADRDNLSYKVCTLSPNMKIDGKSLYDIFSIGGGGALQTQLTEYFGFEIDYYNHFQNGDFITFIKGLGTFIYPSAEQIKFDGGQGEDKYSIRFGEGEQNIDANELSNLLRYYSEDNDKLYVANEIVLYGLTQLFNSENYEDAESLFRLLISSSTTNITVRNFEDGSNGLYVFCEKSNDITVYSARAEYEKDELTQNSLKSIKGYFAK